MHFHQKAKVNGQPNANDASKQSVDSLLMRWYWKRSCIYLWILSCRISVAISWRTKGSERARGLSLWLNCSVLCELCKILATSSCSVNHRNEILEFHLPAFVCYSPSIKSISSIFLRWQREQCALTKPTFSFLGSGSEGNRRRRSHVEYRGNLHVWMSVRTYVCPCAPPWPSGPSLWGTLRGWTDGQMDGHMDRFPM